MAVFARTLLFLAFELLVFAFFEYVLYWGIVLALAPSPPATNAVPHLRPSAPSRARQGLAV
ncbi:MAG: hypothetical protein ACYC3S_04550 [Chloroflexota bacterium]